MYKSPRRIPAIMQAAAVAGPVYVASSAAAQFWDLVPEPIQVDPDAIALFIFTLFGAFFVGLVIAFVPVAIGTLAMSALAERWDAARTVPAWAAAGATSTGGILVLLDEAPRATVFALVSTATVCAVVAHRSLAE